MNHKMTITTTVCLDTQASQELQLPRPAVLGIASGIFFMAFFGAYWGFISAAFISGASQVVAFLLVGLVTLSFFGMGGIVLRYARTLPKTLSPEDAALGKRIWMWFGIIFGIEFILIALASILLSTFQVDSFIAPATALIVAIHFFPLARLFRVPLYSMTGVLLSALALVPSLRSCLACQLQAHQPTTGHCSLAWEQHWCSGLQLSTLPV